MLDQLRAVRTNGLLQDLPEWVGAWYEAECLLAERRVDDAIAAFCAIDVAGLAPTDRARVLTGLGTALRESGDITEAAACIESIDIDGVDHPGYVGRACRLLAECAAHIGDYDRAIALGERAVQGYQACSYPTALANTLTDLATTYHRVGRLTDSIRMQFLAYDAYESSGSALARAIALINLGVIFAEIGNATEARTFFSQARDIPLSEGAARIRLWCSLNLGLLAVEQERAADALPDLHEAVALGTDQQEISTVIGAHRGLAAAYRMLDDLDAAGRHLNMTMTLLSEQPNEPLRITADIERLQLEQRQARHDVVVHDGEDLLAEAQRRHDVPTSVRLLEILATSYAAQGMYQQAFRHLADHTSVKRSLDDDATQQQIAAMRIEQELKAERAAVARERALLRGLLPADVARRLIDGERRIADVHSNACVLFTDIVGFTAMAGRMQASDLIDLLGRIFTIFDEIVSQHDLVRIKTIGDAYMAVALPRSEQRVARSEQRVASSEQRTASAAVAMLRTLAERLPDISIRIGVHCGDVVAGVIGKERPMYDVWGDTVNVASRMESTGEPGRIHVSEAFALRLTAEGLTAVALTPRGVIDVKGKGAMTTYWLTPRA